MKLRKYSNFIRQRNYFNEFLRKFPNVKAYGMGNKFISGKSTEESCLTIFVDRKIEHDRLTKIERIPKAIRFGKQIHLTDVVQMGAFIRQSAPENYPFGLCLSDQKENGTRSAIAATANGIMALTCAHVIAGTDEDPATPAPIKSFNWFKKEWLPYGLSDHAVYEPGQGTPFEFGYLDAALIRLLPGIDMTSVTSKALTCFIPQHIEDIDSLRGKLVNGFGIASGNCQGIVQAVLVGGVGGHFAADIVISALGADGITKAGDSGMLWFDQEGKVIGQHVLGERSPPGKGSMRTIATFIHRINDRLKILSLH